MRRAAADPAAAAHRTKGEKASQKCQLCNRNSMRAELHGAQLGLGKVATEFQLDDALKAPDAGIFTGIEADKPVFSGKKTISSVFQASKVFPK